MGFVETTTSNPSRRRFSAKGSSAGADFAASDGQPKRLLLRDSRR